MKSVIFSILTLVATNCVAQAPDFAKDIATAKTSYQAGKLEDAHFALLQALQEIDIRIGQEILKLLPQQLDTMKANIKEDQVTGNAGFVGSTILRTYGVSRGCELSIIGNSPLIGTLNSLINAPIIGGMMSDANNKIIKVQGYKGRLTKTPLEDGKANYSVDIPMNNSLVTLRMDKCTDTQIMNMANALPLQQIAKLIQ